MKTEKDFQGDLYDLLVLHGEASTDVHRRAQFISYLQEGGSNPKEYRFGGVLGFGGKLWLNRYHDRCPYYVSCYPEDRGKVGHHVTALNEKIQALYTEFKS